MKSTGIVRKLDELGRITLPIELRRNFDVNERDPLEIFVDDDKIILRNWQELPDSKYLNNTKVENSFLNFPLFMFMILF